MSDGPQLVVEPVLVNAATAAAMSGVSLRHWWALDAAGKTPTSVCLGRRRCWHVRTIEAWAAGGCPARDAKGVTV